MLGVVDVGSEKLSKVTSPVCSQQPRCPKWNRFSYSFGFPEGQGPVDGIDSIRTLRFGQVVGKASNEVVKSLDRIATKVLDDLPKLNSATKYGTL